MNAQGIGDLIDNIATHMEALAGIMASPASVDFAGIHRHFGSLEMAMNLKPAIDAAFAYLAELHCAGKLVSSPDTADFLAKELDISLAEARRRLKRGTDLFAPAPPPDKPKESQQESPHNKEKARRQQESAEKAREQSRKEKHVSDEKRRIIDRELQGLTDGAEPGADELRAQALQEAARRSPSDLRNWLRERVKEANRTGEPDPQYAFKKRYFRLGRQDEHGGVPVYGYLPADYAALIAAAMSLHNLDAAARERGVDPDKVKDTYGQQCADRLRDIFASASTSPSQRREGNGSVVISLTLEDIQEMSPTSSFPTNTGYYLNPAELHRLGPALTDYFVLHDTQGQPLSVGRGRRSATLAQRIALFASELVCQMPDCDCPLTMSDIHHREAWSRGGKTDIKNLTIMCWRDHAKNNDKRDGANNRGYMDVDPETGRSGWRDVGAEHLKHNNSTAAQQAAGVKIRKKYASPKEPPPETDMAR